MQLTTRENLLADDVSSVVTRFTEWLEGYGEASWDYQSFFAGPIGGPAKALYYRSRRLGTPAVAPMIFCEALLPSARRLFHRPMRFPIADAHYAMGFAFLYDATGLQRYWDRALHFIDELKKSRCSESDEYCWGYPFDWVTQGGVIKRGTPLITTTPYAYEAFLQMYNLEARDEWKEILASIARHAANDIKDLKTSEAASSSSYTPFGEYYVINASAYRAFLLTSASRLFGSEDYSRIAERNLNFVLQQQNADGSWFYAVDGVRDFIDHFHTCFVMKAIAKIERLTGDGRCREALERGVSYYLSNLFDAEGLPKPFAKAPRLTVYRRELYDYAECINFCMLLRDQFPALGTKVQVVLADIAHRWLKADGSFRSRRLWFGWDNVPMHRWAQSQLFRSLAFYLRDESRVTGNKPDDEIARVPQSSTANSQVH